MIGTKKEKKRKGRGEKERKRNRRRRKERERERAPLVTIRLGTIVYIMTPLESYEN